ncbi:glutamate--tRNA ligase [Limisalsivibrio acetivorans]|uniref:glutamate--tRNA ligase n=1 Tax=Limisalsivibrio acetivorans TaxID=1304888 RepID=UPI0003B78C7D|nr:glutamate--tRNA ligase [Limisalsivibrio acetivorans]
MSVRVRFAPSPTGHLHVGNARTALFNYLFARNQGGAFILRVEDTDIERSSLESEELIYEDMRWLMMDWDEGPRKGGDYGPYRQTERLELYNEYAQKLIDKGQAYRCFCSKDELEKDREKARIEGRAYKYNGKCRNLSDDEINQNLNDGREFSVRFRVDVDEVPVADAVKGDIEFSTDPIGDFIIVRPGGVPVYNFVVVIDDALMKISHVIRGDDHLSNTPKQALIFDALGFKRPVFAHIPMILGPDKSKLSKRHGNTSVEQFRKQGYLPEAIFNFLALLSWSDEEEREMLDAEELIKVFTLNRVSTSAAVFDFDKLRWMNGNYIRSKSSEELAEIVKPFVQDVLPEGFAEKNPERYERMVYSIHDKFDILSEAADQLKVYFEFQEPDEAAKEILELETTPAVLEAFKTKSLELGEYIPVDMFKPIPKAIQKETGAKGKALFMAIRVGLSGSSKGPELDKLATLLPVEELVRRIDKTLEMITK